ncbi:hypothetical protein [Bythopirellula polymerisocia]|nr:hypothetical protein [Bythopirellula polymerisocia]
MTYTLLHVTRSIHGRIPWLLGMLLLVTISIPASAQTILIDLGNDNSYRGASVSNPDVNGNYWNSVWSGALYPNLLDIQGNATTVDLGFSSAAGTDSYNGPAGPTDIYGPSDSVYNAAALGNLGVQNAVYDYYVSSNFQIQELDPAKTYDLTFFGSHKYNNDDTTKYTIYTDDTFTTPVSSANLFVGSGASHNQSNVVTIQGVAPQANNNLYVGFQGANGGSGYLNAFQITEAQEPPPPPPPPGPNSKKIYMHYMPWFDTPQSLGGSAGNNWGGHWTGFGATNPNNISAEGKRQIASKYYPKIGPYESSDPDVLEYHMLLMKMAGVDGILIDWYGVQGTNGDINSLLKNSNAIVAKTDDFAMDFGVVLEDRFAANTGQVATNVAYLRDNYFNKPEYIRIGAGDDPLLAVFGPITQQQPANWTTILAQAGEPVELLPLWGEKNDAGSNATGEYVWIYENEATDDYLTRLESFYQNRAPGLGTVGGVAYPGFDAFGGFSFEIPHDDGQTLANTLALAGQYSDDLDFIQLATFNDFGEGTIFEPTVETGFAYLMQIQEFTEVPYGEAELQLVFDLFRARKEFSGNTTTQSLLNQASAHLKAYEIEDAQAILDSIYPPGDFDGDGDADGADFLIWQRQNGSTGFYPLNTLEADGNADGVVDEKDLLLWKQHSNNVSMALPLRQSLAIPEPSTVALLLPIGLGILLRVF